MNKSSFTGFLSLCQRERIKVRDCPTFVALDFAALATICVHTLSSSCGGNERGSLFHFLIAWVSREEKSKAPHLDPIPVSGERRTAT
jgi:hypothetical protein